jgi:hypothetical protein
MPKTHYHSSGKINIVPLIIATVLASIACIGGAIFYSTAGEPGEFSGGKLVCLMMLIIWMFSMFYLFKRYNHSRNMKVNIVIGVCICLASLYFSRAGWEGLALLLPVSIMFMMNYYCEKCRKYYSKKTSYILEAKKFMNLSNRSRNYSFLPDMNFYDEPVRELDPSDELIRVDYFYCMSCESKPIADIHLCKWEKHRAHRKFNHNNTIEHQLFHDEHERYHWRITQKEALEEGIYLDNETGRKLSLLLGY